MSRELAFDPEEAQAHKPEENKEELTVQLAQPGTNQYAASYHGDDDTLDFSIHSNRSPI